MEVGTMEKCCKSMPKVELHAHLNGSITDNTLQKLILEHDLDPPSNAVFQLMPNNSRTFTECFQIFKFIHDVIRTPDILHTVTMDVINSFVNDNVIYLELRTTPKAVHEIPSKEVYLEAVIAAIQESKKIRSSILVKLLISIDRQRGAEDGGQNVDLAIEFAKKYPDIVVGIDLSGNPTEGSMIWILPLLTRAREHELQLTCHLPEMLNLEETDRLLEFNGIGRFGHGLYIHPKHGATPRQWEIMKQKRIPIEVCITSNLISGVTASVEEHYVQALHEDAMPFVICTDDSGVFNTTLSEEYIKFLQIVPMSLPDLRIFTLDSISCAFCSHDEKERLRSTVTEWWESNS